MPTADDLKTMRCRCGGLVQQPGRDAEAVECVDCHTIMHWSRARVWHEAYVEIDATEARLGAARLMLQKCQNLVVAYGGPGSELAQEIEEVLRLTI